MSNLFLVTWRYGYTRRQSREFAELSSAYSFLRMKAIEVGEACGSEAYLWCPIDGGHEYQKMVSKYYHEYLEYKRKKEMAKSSAKIRREKK